MLFSNHYLNRTVVICAITAIVIFSLSMIHNAEREDRHSNPPGSKSFHPSNEAFTSEVPSSKYSSELCVPKDLNITDLSPYHVIVTSTNVAFDAANELVIHGDNFHSKQSDSLFCVDMSNEALSAGSYSVHLVKGSKGIGTTPLQSMMHNQNVISSWLYLVSGNGSLRMLQSENRPRKCNTSSGATRCLSTDKETYSKAFDPQIVVEWENNDGKQTRIVIVTAGGKPSDSNARVKQRRTWSAQNSNLKCTGPKVINGKVEFLPMDIDPGTYNVYLTTRGYDVRAGPLSITIVGNQPPAAPPVSVPSTIPPPVAPPVQSPISAPTTTQSPTNCKTVQGKRRCISTDQSTYTKAIGSQIDVNWENNSGDKTRIVIVSSGTKTLSDVNSRLLQRNTCTAAQSSNPQCTGGVTVKNGMVTFSIPIHTNPGQYDVYLTTRSYNVHAGPLTITIAEDQPPVPSPIIAPSTEPPVNTPYYYYCNEPDEIEALQESIIISTDDSGQLPTEILGARANVISNNAPNVVLKSTTATGWDHYGCFYRNDDYGIFPNGFHEQYDLPPDATSFQQKTESCQSLCPRSPNFAFSSSKCYCFGISAETRLSFGRCNQIKGNTCIHDDNLIDAFIRSTVEPDCDLPTEMVRNLFSQQKGEKLGYDFITDTLKPSPFLLETSKCGTNVYDITRTASESSRTVKTTSKTLTEFANEKRTNITASLKASQSFEAGIGPWKAKGDISASYDTTQNRAMKRTGSDSAESEIISTFGVKRTADVFISDFDHKYNFVTFNRPLGSRLREYKKQNFPRDLAEGIFDSYGMFILERAIYGGYMELNSIMSSSALNRFSSNNIDITHCAEVSVSGKFEASGFSSSRSIDASGCNEKEIEEIKKKQEEFSSTFGTTEVRGGRVFTNPKTGIKEFQSEPDQAIMLRDKKFYPNDDQHGAQFRLLTDFLSPSRIHPTEYVTHQLTEDDFITIQETLNQHMFDIVTELGSKLEECDSPACGYTFLDGDDRNSLECVCVSLKPPDINWALYRPTVQSSNFYSTPVGEGASANAVNGNLDGEFTYTTKELEPYWKVDLQHSFHIQRIVVNLPSQFKSRAQNFKIEILDKEGTLLHAARQINGETNDVQDRTIFTIPNNGENIQASQVRISLPGNGSTKKFLNLQEVEVYGDPIIENVALGKPATQSSLWSDNSGRPPSLWVAGIAVDGSTSHGFTHTIIERDPWWIVHLQDSYNIKSVKVYLRSDCCFDRSDGFIVETYHRGTLTYFYQHITTPDHQNAIEIMLDNELGPVYADTLKIRLEGDNRILSLAEVEVYGIPKPYDVSDAPIVPAYVPKTGLVGWWDFDNGSGKDALQKNDFMSYGADVVPDHNGIPNSAISLNRSLHQNMKITSPTFQFGSESPFTISFWVKDGDGAVLFSGGEGSDNLKWLLGVRSFAQGFATGTNWYRRDGWSYIRSDGQSCKDWCHIMALYDQRTMTLLVNNIVVATGQYTDVSTEKKTNPLILGFAPNGMMDPFKGHIDNIGVWDRRLWDFERCSLLNEYQCNE